MTNFVPPIPFDEMKRVVLKKLRNKGNKIVVEHETESHGEIIERFDLDKIYDRFVVFKAKNGTKEAFLFSDLYRKLR